VQSSVVVTAELPFWTIPDRIIGEYSRDVYNLCRHCGNCLANAMRWSNFPVLSPAQVSTAQRMSGQSDALRSAPKDKTICGRLV
jgi:hypothetical protein